MRKSVLIIGLLVYGLSVTACQKSPIEESYNIERPSFDGDLTTYALSEKPSGVNMTYYSDIYSRGFSWLTNSEVEETKLFLVKSDKGEKADFSNAQSFDGSVTKITYETNGDFKTENDVIPAYPHKSGDNSSNDYVLNVNSHKVHIDNLEKGKAYSYKIGSERGWAYGGFYR